MEMAPTDYQNSPLNPKEEEPFFAALQHLQEEMETIGYIASHDLLAPVRLMEHSYAMLQEKLGASAPPDAEEPLQSLKAEIANMRARVQGLQDYIRLETFVPKHIALDAEEIVTTVIDTMADEIRAAGATVTCDNMASIKVMGHRGRLARLFAQLIDNAIKFHGNRPPEVDISAKRTGDTWTFCVADNGIGIDEEQQEVMFRLFQRLNGEAYPGHGIGLALSRKIVASHGSTLWVESAPGKGSRFFFTLPAVDK